MELLVSTWMFTAMSPVLSHSASIILGLMTGVVISYGIERFILSSAGISVGNEIVDLRSAMSNYPATKHAPQMPQPTHIFSKLYHWGNDHNYQTQLPVSCPLTGIACASLFLLLSFLFITPLTLLCAFILCSFLLTLSLIDFRTYLLPDALTLPLLWIGLLSHTLINRVSLEDAVFGAVAGYLALWCLYWAFKLMTGREGMGYGDFKLLAALGAWVGWQSLPLICVVSSLAGVGMTIFGRLNGRATVVIPFGPCLAIAGMFSYISQQDSEFWLMYF